MELRWQRKPKTQIFAENRRFLQIHPFSWKFQHLDGAGNRRFSQETAVNCRLGSVTLGPSPLARPYLGSSGKFWDVQEGCKRSGEVWLPPSDTPMCQTHESTGTHRMLCVGISKNRSWFRVSRHSFVNQSRGESMCKCTYMCQSSTEWP